MKWTNVLIKYWLLAWLISAFLPDDPHLIGRELFILLVTVALTDGVPPKPTI